MNEAKDTREMKIVLALGVFIKTVGQIPSGELYARIMDKIDIHEYNAAIDILVRSKSITNKYHLLTWIGEK